MAGAGDREPRRSSATEIGQHLGHGLAWVASTALFLFLGWLLDGRIGTAPLFTIVGAFVGAAAGFYNLYRQLIVVPRAREKGGGKRGGQD